MTMCPYCTNKDLSLISKINSVYCKLRKIVKVTYHCEVCAREFVIWKDNAKV